jgi:hypothetical protein
VWLDLSFWYHFDLFLLCWDELGCELSLFTKGFHLIPHEFIDRGESCCRVSKSVFFGFSWFPVDWLQIGWWPLRGSSPTALWPFGPILVAVGWDLAANRSKFGRRRFSKHYVLSNSWFADSPLVTCGQSECRARFCAFAAARCSYRRTVQPQAADSLGPCFRPWTEPVFSVFSRCVELWTVRH